MKRMVCKLLVIALILGNIMFVYSCSNLSSGQNEQSENESMETKDNVTVGDVVTDDLNEGLQKPQYLVNTLYKLQTEKKLTVGYLGGSVTFGTGASEPNKTSWRGLTNQWLRGKFPMAQISEVNASIGNTGSAFGMYRIEQHLLKQQLPDIVFVECAVNDTIDIVNGSRVYGSDDHYVYIETIVQKIYKANPNADIVFVLTGNFEYLQREIDEEIVFGTPYIDLAAHYDIPVIRVGSALAETIKAENNGVFPSKTGNEYPALWQKYAKAANDNVHLNDAGYKVYGDTVRAALSSWLLNGYTAMTVENKILPSETYCSINRKGELCLDACMIDPFRLKTNLGGFSVEKSGVSNTPYSLKSTTAGDEIEFVFNASTFGLWMVAPQRGESTYITYSVDGGEEVTLEIVYGSVRNHKLFILAQDLHPGETHTIKIKHLDNKIFDCRYILLNGFAGKSCLFNTL